MARNEHELAARGHGISSLADESKVSLISFFLKEISRGGGER